MRILMTMHMPYLLTFGGANKNNRLIAEALASEGHEVLAIVPAFGVPPGGISEAQFAKALSDDAIGASYHDGVYTFDLHKVKVNAVGDPLQLSEHLSDQLRLFRPNCVIVASEEPEQRLLEISLNAACAPVVCIAQTPALLPFGPHSLFPSKAKTLIFERVSHVVTTSNFLAQYIRSWSSVNPEAIYMPVYGSGPYRNLADFDTGFVTLVNPCKMKGITIFLELAAIFPEIQFAAVPTWGTTSQDRIALRSLPNIFALEPCATFEIILSKTRILLMPSLWLENFPLTLIEAMLRGIPVISSNIGGIPEAKLGTDLVLPVNPISVFTSGPEQEGELTPVIPVQDIAPWRSTLSDLLSNRLYYEQQSETMRHAALRFVRSLSIKPLEGLLNRVSGFSRATN